MILPERVLVKPGAMNEVRRGDWTDLLAHPVAKFLSQLFGESLARHQGHIAIDALSLHVVRIADHGGLGLEVGARRGLQDEEMRGWRVADERRRQS